ncbi:MAG: phosphoribosyltransferase-like protein [Ginsengibacter sp.]
MEIDKLFTDFPKEEELIEIIRHTSTTVWESELVGKDIESWLGNFKGETCDLKYERLLALWLLSHFTFYNKHEVRHLCKVIYRNLIHKIVEGIDITKIKPEDAVKDFFSKSNVISSEETSGSGGFIAYFFRHENKLPMTLFNFSVENISDDIENIIIIDDVTLSQGAAGQMFKFWTKTKAKYPKKKFYLLSLMASEASFKYLKTNFNIEVITAIRLDNRDKCFHSESDVFSSFSDPTLKKELIQHTKSFAVHYGRKINVPMLHPLGHSDGQFTFGFFYNTPDNTLPIFWGQINGWIPILKRYHKNYKTQTYLHHERFI